MEFKNLLIILSLICLIGLAFGGTAAAEAGDPVTTFDVSEGYILFNVTDEGVRAKQVSDKYGQAFSDEGWDEYDSDTVFTLTGETDNVHSGVFIFSGRDEQKKAKFIVFEPPVLNLVLDNVTIDKSVPAIELPATSNIAAPYFGPAISLTAGTNVSIVLKEKSVNTLKGFVGSAGIYVPEDSTLNLSGESEKALKNPGVLEVHGGDSYLNCEIDFSVSKIQNYAKRYFETDDLTESVLSADDVNEFVLPLGIGGGAGIGGNGIITYPSLALFPNLDEDDFISGSQRSQSSGKIIISDKASVLAYGGRNGLESFIPDDFDSKSFINLVMLTVDFYYPNIYLVPAFGGDGAGIGGGGGSNSGMDAKLLDVEIMESGIDGTGTVEIYNSDVFAVSGLAAAIGGGSSSLPYNPFSFGKFISEGTNGGAGNVYIADTSVVTALSDFGTGIGGGFGMAGGNANIEINDSIVLASGGFVAVDSILEVISHLENLEELDHECGPSCPPEPSEFLPAADIGGGFGFESSGTAQITIDGERTDVISLFFGFGTPDFGPMITNADVEYDLKYETYGDWSKVTINNGNVLIAGYRGSTEFVNEMGRQICPVTYFVVDESGSRLPSVYVNAKNTVDDELQILSTAYTRYLSLAGRLGMTFPDYWNNLITLGTVTVWFSPTYDEIDYPMVEAVATLVERNPYGFEIPATITFELKNYYPETREVTLLPEMEALEVSSEAVSYPPWVNFKEVIVMTKIPSSGGPGQGGPAVVTYPTETIIDNTNDNVVENNNDAEDKPTDDTGYETEPKSNIIPIVIIIVIVALIAVGAAAYFYRRNKLQAK
ncbi:hypothetical protein MmiAt1_08300 [Methanimicrococcus sp. At1]|uniref:Uncharacterized protein n=1 Tax=Methanimicrococcus hacksteinii TaxID=3028293 RepID=A0ABU3VPC6_9EURY|nr:hypothetical protein [Methanimicrococcus sp. At1]MDV0445262.1 hypothetical protein [Methanimicrococcus sp. At1]